MREDAPRYLEEASCDASDTFLPRQPYSCLGRFEESCALYREPPNKPCTRCFVITNLRAAYSDQLLPFSTSAITSS